MHEKLIAKRTSKIRSFVICSLLRRLKPPVTRTTRYFFMPFGHRTP
jgi:hypothetical protein